MLLNTESLPFYIFDFGGAAGQLGHKIRQIIMKTSSDKEVKVHECKDVQRKSKYSKSESEPKPGCACTPWKLADLFKFMASCSITC